MQTWSVTARGLASVEVQGRNWIVALGRGLEELGRVAALQRLACEVLPNGTVIARDIVTGTGYVVQLADPSASAVAAAGGSGEGSEEFALSSEDSTELPFAVDDQEDTAPVEPIYDLPTDAIAELTIDEGPVELILAADTPKEACRRTLEAALLRIPAEVGAVLLEERGYLRFVAVEGPTSRKLTGMRLPLGTGVAGYALEKRKTVVLANAQEDVRHRGELDALTGYVTRELVVMPIVRNDRVLGVVELTNLREGRRFDEPELELLSRLVDGLAVRLSH